MARGYKLRHLLGCEQVAIHGRFPSRKGEAAHRLGRAARSHRKRGLGNGYLWIVLNAPHKALADVVVGLSRDKAPQLHALHELIAMFVALPAVVGIEDTTDFWIIEIARIKVAHLRCGRIEA